MPHYYNIDKFIRSVLLDEQPDLSFYRDQQFCRAIKLHALEAIESILLQMKQQHSICEQNSKIFDLRKAACKVHADTNLSMLDYAVLAGIPELAYHFAAWGCTSNYDAANFKLILKADFSKYAPLIVVEIQKSLILAMYGKHSAMQMPLDNEESNKQLHLIQSILKKVKALLAMYDPPDPEFGANVRIFDQILVEQEPESVRPLLFHYLCQQDSPCHRGQAHCARPRI